MSAVSYRPAFVTESSLIMMKGGLIMLNGFAIEVARRCLQDPSVRASYWSMAPIYFSLATHVVRELSTATSILLGKAPKMLHAAANAMDTANAIFNWLSPITSLQRVALQAADTYVSYLSINGGNTLERVSLTNEQRRAANIRN